MKKSSRTYIIYKAGDVYLRDGKTYIDKLTEQQANYIFGKSWGTDFQKKKLDWIIENRPDSFDKAIKDEEALDSELQEYLHPKAGPQLIDEIIDDEQKPLEERIEVLLGLLKEAEWCSADVKLMRDRIIVETLREILKKIAI